MPPVKLTDAIKDVLIFDSELKGFGVRVTPGRLRAAEGTRAFLFQYNGPSRKHRMPLGTALVDYFRGGLRRTLSRQDHFQRRGDFDAGRRGGIRQW